MTCKSLINSLIVVVLLPLFAFPAIAQTSSATLQGTITDQQGQVVPGAKVTVQSPATGLQRQVTTNEAGLYIVNFLPVGAYTVMVEARSFKQARLENITLEIGQTRALDVSLEIGAVEQTVTIVDTAPPLDRNSAAISTVIQSSQIKELPLNGRNWAGLMLLAPGAINTGEGNHLSTRFVGRSRDDNNWTFDGVDSTGVKDPRQEANLRLVISTDAIRNSASTRRFMALIRVRAQADRCRSSRAAARTTLTAVSTNSCATTFLTRAFSPIRASYRRFV